MLILGWIFEALEGWGITKLFGWLSSFFQHTPQKDMEAAHEVDNHISGLSDGDVDKRVQSIERD